VRATPLIAAAIAVALVALAVPRLLAGAISGPFDDTVRALGRGDPVSDDALLLALGSRLRAIALIGDARYHADVAALRFADYLANPEQSWRLDLAIAAHRDALDRAPAQPFLWSRLALAEMLRDGYRPAVGEALRLSLATGRHEPRLLMPRLELAFTVWPLLPDALRAELAQQVVLAMRWQPQALVAATRRYHRLAEVRDALVASPDLRNRFNLLYEKARLG
jgi:hypothetical protein